MAEKVAIVRLLVEELVERADVEASNRDEQVPQATGLTTLAGRMECKRRMDSYSPRSMLMRVSLLVSCPLVCEQAI